ncbi:unnamed protein product [Schistosoma turkestanicum]|nr:unnamed protein product [Schistosoma turkestanicum]
MCRWMPDPRNNEAHWRIEHSKTKQGSMNGILCMSLSTLQRDAEKLENLVPFEIDTSSSDFFTARLWSDKFHRQKSHVDYRCLTLSYIIEGKNRKTTKPTTINYSQHIPQLTLLRHSSGSCTKKFVNGRKESLLCENEKLWSSDYLFHAQNNLLSSSSSWKTITLSLIDSNEPILTDYKLILEGTIPAGYPDARICVDNITSYTEPCSALEKASAPLPSQWSWAQYFGFTFVGALILGLLIPVLFLVILIWACRRRHHATHSNYTNNKLFSTNLWYYIGGKEMCNDPNGFRGSSSLLRSKQFNSPSATGTLLNSGGGHHMMLSNADVMDLPDVVVPGGRVIAFNYSGNTLGGNTLRHNQNNTGYTNTNYLPNVQNGQIMPTNANATISSNSCGTNVTTVARTCPNPMPLVSNEQLQGQQQGEAYNYQTNPVFGESASMAMMTVSQSPMLMTQSMAPNYGSESNNIAQSNLFNNNAQQINQLNPNSQVYNKPVIPTSTQQQQQQPQQPRAQSQYFPPTQQLQANLIQPQPQTTQPFQQQSSNFPNQNQLQQQQQQQQPQQQLATTQAPVSNQFYPQQQQPQPQQQQQQFPLPPPPSTCPLQQMNTQQTPNLPSLTQQQTQPVLLVQQSVSHQYPFQSQPQSQPQQQQQQQQPQPMLTDQRGQQIVNGLIPTSVAAIAIATTVPLVTSQPTYQTPIQQPCSIITVNTGNHHNLTNGHALTTIPTNRCLSMSPNSIGTTDSLTEADQQVAMALLAAATEGMDSFRENQTTTTTTPISLQSPVPIIINNMNGLDACLNNHSNNNNNNSNTNNSNNNNNNNSNSNNNNAQVPVDEDNPPPGYDEAIGLIQTNFINNVNMAMMMNTMIKPAVPIPSTTCTPPPALPPRRIINGVGLEEDIDDPQSMTACLSLAERYGLPVAEI